MSTEQYVSIAVKKEMLKTIGKLDPDKTLEALVTEAIVEYIRNKTFSVTNETLDVRLLKFDFTPNTGNTLTNGYTLSP
jgi:hypothetical protein